MNVMVKALLVLFFCFPLEDVFGTYVSSNVFILNAIPVDTLKPISDYSVLLDKYNSGVRDTSLLHSLIVIAEKEKDSIRLKYLVIEYLGKLTPPLTIEEGRIVSRYTKTSSDLGFKLLIEASKNTNYNKLPTQTDSRLMYIIYKEEIEKEIAKKEYNSNWDSIKNGIVNKYGKIGDEIFCKAKSLFFYKRHYWNEFVSSFSVYLSKYPHRMPLEDINDFAWYAYSNIKNKVLLRKVLKWSKMTLAENSPYNYDTYANILFALGQEQVAIYYEEKAVDMATDQLKDEYKITLKKMRERTLLK